MDAKVFAILETLENVPYAQNGNIADFINENFPFKPSTDEYTFNNGRNVVVNFLRGLETDGYVKYKYQDGFDTVTTFRNQGQTNSTKWIPYTFDATLTEAGRTGLKKERDRKLNSDVSQSAISVNQSIIATNEAVQNMNKRMLEHSERQEAIMLQQSGFAQEQVRFTERQVALIEQQVTLITTQNNLYRNTLILAGINILIGLIILWVTISSNADKLSIVSLQSQLTAQKKEIRRLQLLKSDTVHYVLHYPLLKSTLKKKEK